MLVPSATFGKPVVLDTPLPTPARGLWIAGAGTVRIQHSRDNADTCDFTVGANTLLPVQAYIVTTAGTSATGIVALF